MVELDLCGEKKFPDEYDTIDIHEEKQKISYLSDEKGNFWERKGIISKGAYGKVINFQSFNKKYQDLAVKFFFENDKNMFDEVEMVNFFNKNKCPNFIKSKAVNYKEGFIIIMEKIDGELLDLRYGLFPNPIKIYGNFVNFIISSFECALKKDKLFTDVKEENIGYKKCKDGLRFTLLDYGSFTDVLEDKNFTSTININQRANEKKYFSKKTLTIFGTTIMLLSQRLSVKSYRYSIRFNNFVNRLGNNKKYPKTKLLDTRYYNLIKEKYLSYIPEEDYFSDKLLDILLLLTQKEIEIIAFLNYLKYYV